MSADTDSKCCIILGGHYWALLVWKLVDISVDGRLRIFRLGDQGCEFEFAYNFAEWRALPCAVKWLDRGEGIVIQKIGGAEAVEKNYLRFSNNLTHNDLVQLANHLKLGIAKNKSRTELLTALAMHLGDESFAALVVEQDSKANKKGSIANGALVQCLYKNLDDDQRGDFDSMKEAADRSEKAAVQKRWQNFLKERTDEVQATQMVFSGQHFSFAFFVN